MYESVNSASSAPGDFESGGSAYAYRKWCGIRRSTWLLVIYILTYLSFLVVGGYLMGVIEEDNEQRLKREVHNKKRDFLSRNPTVSKSDLESLLETSQGYRDLGISALDKDSDDRNWSMGQSVLFTVTVVTTIGYGHITPLTFNGKLFCILYAIFGIPFTLVFLTATVQRLLEPTCSILAYFFARLGARISPFAIRVIHLVFMSVLFIIFFVFLPTLVFYGLEPDWTWLDGLYFVFISVTTIGLGDYIPGDHEEQRFRDLYKLGVAVYLLFGLIFMTLTATVFYDIPQLNLGTVLHQHKDIHLPTDEDPQPQPATEKTGLRESFRKLLAKPTSKVEPEQE